jgi:hypothetical protein
MRKFYNDITDTKYGNSARSPSAFISNISLYFKLSLNFSSSIASYRNCLLSYEELEKQFSCDKWVYILDSFALNKRDVSRVKFRANKTISLFITLNDEGENYFLTAIMISPREL